MENCLETLQNGLEVKSNLISYVEPYSPLNYAYTSIHISDFKTKHMGHFMEIHLG